MKLKHTTGLLLSLALTVLPATAALAKPVASHHLDVQWSSFESGVAVNGSLDLTIDEGITTVRLIWADSRLGACGDGSSGVVNRSVEYAGPASLAVTVDRHLELIEVTGDLEVVETVTTCGSRVVSTSTLPLNLSGSAVDRPVRSRDRASGTRYVDRAHEFQLELGVEKVLDFGVLTKSISSS